MTALDRALATASAPARALFALRWLEGMPEVAAMEVLARIGIRADPTARRHAGRLLYLSAATAGLENAAEFDPCSVQTRPTDLLRRRRRRRLAGLAAVLALLAAVFVPPTVPGHDSLSPSAADDAQPAGAAPVLDAGRLVRAPDGRWADTSRVDFTAWPARGGRTHDTALLNRALAAWSRPARDVHVTVAAATTTEPPAKPPALLYAGDLDGRAVVVLHDDSRVVRYTEPQDGEAAPTLEFARADDADVTTAAAVVVSRTAREVRFLTAPWIAATDRRDLLRPDTSARSVHVSRDGVTDPVARPRYGGDCAARPALQLRSSSRIVEHHAFVLADLGDLLPVHLTYLPLPGRERPRPPREATSETALRAWRGSACGLSALRGGGVRSVSVWDFVRQELPDHGGPAVWSCQRADTWRGPGDVVVGFRRPEDAPDADTTVVARDRDTAACSRFGQHVVASTRWRSPSGKWYLLAAGSRAVTDIEVTGDVRATVHDPTLARRAKKDARTQVTARLPEGETLRPPGSG